MISPEQIVRDLQRTLPVLQEEATKAMHAAVDLTALREREIAPGKIAASVRTTVRENQTGVTGTITPRSPASGFVDRGTGELHDSGFHHPITARNHRVLRWLSPDGEMLYRRVVKGQRPQHFIERARDESAVEVENLLVGGAVSATNRLF